jgi:hypothetical protein
MQVFLSAILSKVPPQKQNKCPFLAPIPASRTEHATANMKKNSSVRASALQIALAITWLATPSLRLDLSLVKGTNI